MQGDHGEAKFRLEPVIALAQNYGLSEREVREAQRLIERHKCGWSPLDGHRFGSRIDATWVNGRLVYRDGISRPQAFGQRIAFA